MGVFPVKAKDTTPHLAPFAPHPSGGHHGTGVVHELRADEDGKTVSMRIHHAPKSGRGGADGVALPWEGHMTTVPLKADGAEQYAVGDKVHVHVKPEGSSKSEGEGSDEPKGKKGFKRRPGPESKSGEEPSETD